MEENQNHKKIKMKKSIEDHINKDREILQDPTLSPQMRRHTAEELNRLEKYRENHLGDDYDPTPLELYCDENPDANECKIYED